MLPEERVHLIGVALKAANFRSTTGYLERCKREHISAGGQLDASLSLVFRSANRAAIRGLGPSRRAEVFTLESWIGAVGAQAPACTGGPRFPGRFITVGTWWLMREVEI